MIYFKNINKNYQLFPFMASGIYTLLRKIFTLQMQKLFLKITSKISKLFSSSTFMIV